LRIADSKIYDLKSKIRNPKSNPMKDFADTICALSTPPGRSGIAVVRMSGAQCLAIFRRAFKAKRTEDAIPSRCALLGQILDPRDGSTIDEAIGTFFPSPHSYTGEDMAEFSLHGSPVIVAVLLDCLCSLGARLAEPGEFTMRAFLHRKIDLTQAEAVQDIIGATTLYQAQVAERQRSGELAQQLRLVKEQLIDIIVNLESAVEFAESELPVASRAILIGKIDLIGQELREWINSYRRGRIVKEGFNMAIIGRPNVGKSSVFNVLLAKDRSIVTEVPGTTRDLVSEYTNLGGIPIHLVDTAGIRQSTDRIEKMGIDRSIQAMVDANAILLVVDASRPRSKHDWILKEKLGGLSCIVVMNKSDLPAHWSFAEKREYAGEWPFIDVSAKEGSGIEELRAAILSGLLESSAQQEGIMITNLRHYHNLEETENNLEHGAAALREGLSEEFALIDLHAGLRKLGEITGETHVEDLLTEIFSRFCIGK
jgi:tRNA modification GTPase